MNYSLNPEAPEFYPNLTSVTQVGYVSLGKSVKSSRTMPSGVSYQHFRTFPDFIAITERFGKNLAAQSNSIVKSKYFKCFDNESNFDRLTDANDTFIDRVNINIDMVAGKRPLESQEGLNSWEQATPKLPSPKIQYCSILIGAKNILRPQLSFKDPVDNSENLWVPKITLKPNNIKPLALTMLYDDDNKPIGYEHPYKIELELYTPPEKFMSMGDEPEPPASLDQTPVTMVETEAQVDALIQHLYTVDEMAVDLEHHSYRTYQGITCLMQISTDTGGDFLIDTLALREHMYKFNEIFTDPKKLKVFHGADNDVLWLQRDFGVYVVGMFDTHLAARQLELSGFSLKHVLTHYCQYEANKTFQLADWRIRPLPEELIAYARSDTHYLLYVARRMRRELLGKLDGRTPLLASVFERSTALCGKTYEKEVLNDRSHIPMLERARKRFNSRQMAALKLLYRYRDLNARELDESPSYLIPNYMLLTLTETLPRDMQGVEACCKPMPPFVRQNIITIHRMLLSCREMKLEPQLYQMPEAISSMVELMPRLDHHIHDHSHLPDNSDDLDINLDGGLELARQPYKFEPDIHVAEFVPRNVIRAELSVDAKTFIPPFDRYKKYRRLAQIQEMKEFRDNEAKLKALSKGNELLKPELLLKLQAQEATEEKDQAKDPEVITDEKMEVKVVCKSLDRENEGKDIPRYRAKRKMPPSVPKKRVATERKQNKDSIYKNYNYKKFYDDSGEVRKQNKPKHKKR